MSHLLPDGTHHQTVSAATDLVQFRPSPIEGMGGFARVRLAVGTRVLEYIGIRISSSETLARCEKGASCIFSLGKDQALDGDVPWNPARFLNHSCAPNCEARLEEGRIWLVAIRDIPPGEELTFNYGYDLEDYKSYPCSCGSPQCVGYMVAEVFFDHVRQQCSLSASAGAVFTG